jgi:pilus assembly protein CpaB
MNYRLRNIVLALVLGVVAAAIALVYASHARTQTSASGTATVVLVAGQDIPVGTAGADLVRSARVRTVAIASSDLVPGAVTNAASLRGLVATQPIYAGEQLTVRRFGAAGAQGLRSGLHGALRIVDLPGDPHQLLSGTLRDGDHVDVVASIRKPESGQTHFSQVVLRNLLVVGPPSGDTASSVSTKDSFSVRLQLTDAQEQSLFYVEQNADWTLALRPAVDPTNTPATSASAESILAGSSGR